MLALALTSPRHQASTRTATLTLAPGQAVVHTETYVVTAWTPRGGYSLAATATDSSADTASGAATFFVSGPPCGQAGGSPGCGHGPGNGGGGPTSTLS